MDSSLSRLEFENQLEMEHEILPHGIIIALPDEDKNALGNKVFRKNILRHCLGSKWYCLLPNKEHDWLMHPVRLSSKNFDRYGEKNPGHDLDMCKEEMISARMLYERLSGAIYDFCRQECEEEIPPPPAFEEYRIPRPLSPDNHLGRPESDFQRVQTFDGEVRHNIRDSLAQVLTWDDLRSNFTVRECINDDVYTDAMQDHYKSFMNTQFTPWLKSVHPFLARAIAQRFGNQYLTLGNDESVKRLCEIQAVREQIASRVPRLCGNEHEWRIGDLGITHIT